MYIVKKMKKIADRARERELPILERGLIKYFEKNCKMHEDKIELK